MLEQILPGIRATRPHRAALALRTLAGDYFKVGRYADSCDAYSDLLQHFDKEFGVAELQTIRDNLHTFELFRDAAPQTVSGDRRFTVPMRADPTGDLDVPVEVIGVKQWWILDTGANESVIAMSSAKQMGLTLSTDASSLEHWKETTKFYRNYFWDEVIGRVPDARLPSNPRTRLVLEEPKFRGYEVVLDVWPGVVAYGILLLPKDRKPGERRPVVVCQHGLEGRPSDLTDPKVDNDFYHHFAADLAEEGFVAFAPQNPYIGHDRFRMIQRLGHPLKLALFSFILGQHEQLLDWLAEQPFVDPQRIGFYGLSYGGKTAVRVPPLLDRYALSICSGDFNEWVWKTTTVVAPQSYLLTVEYDMYEFGFANAVNYSDLANLMAPRPFMVERGHDDPVGVDEWVSYEYAAVRRFYDKIGIADKTEIEFFNGPHTIHGVGTFAFLRRHLRWPETNVIR